MSETQVSQTPEVSAPDEAPLFDYLRANLGAARLLFENMTANLANEIIYALRPSELESKYHQPRAEASTMLGEIFNAFELVSSFVENAKFYGLDDLKPEAYIDDLLRALRDLAKVYVDLKKGKALSDVMSSISDIRARLDGAYNSILEALISKVRATEVTTENKP